MRLGEFVLSKNKDDVTRAIKESVQEHEKPQFRSAAVKFLKLVITEDQKFDGAVPKAAEKDTAGMYNIEEVCSVSVLPTCLLILTDSRSRSLRWQIGEEVENWAWKGSKFGLCKL